MAFYTAFFEEHGTLEQTSIAYGLTICQTLPDESTALIVGDRQNLYSATVSPAYVRVTNKDKSKQICSPLLRERIVIYHNIFIFTLCIVYVHSTRTVLHYTNRYITLLYSTKK